MTKEQIEILARDIYAQGNVHLLRPDEIVTIIERHVNLSTLSNSSPADWHRLIYALTDWHAKPMDREAAQREIAERLAKMEARS